MEAWKIRMERLKSVLDMITPSKAGYALSMGADVRVIYTCIYLHRQIHTVLFHMPLMMYNTTYCAQPINQPLLKYTWVSHKSLGLFFLTTTGQQDRIVECEQIKTDS